FSKLFGREPGADKCLEPGLLNNLNEVHIASKNDTLLPEKKHKDIFSYLLNWEQQLLDPIIQKAFDNFKIPILRHIALNPWVGLSFIPKPKILLFRNFTDPMQRIQTGSKIYDIASNQGWDNVSKSLFLYEDCPRDLESQSSKYQEEMNSKMLQIKSLNH
ncbi:MAG: hypothetical protein K2X66_00600, partial [Cyanobacteria bacterium]|nr:hypothetical protein [Cyanobacteriota bacterium]